MTEQILGANENSPLMKELSKGYYENFEYGMQQNYPMISKKLISVEPDSSVNGSPYGQETTFTIPRNFLVSGMIVETNFVMASGSDNTASNDYNIGAKLFQNIDLYCKNNLIYSQPDGASKIEGLQQPLEQSLAFHRLTNAETDSLNGEAYGLVSDSNIQTFTPIYYDLFEKRAFDTQFLEELKLNLRFNNQTRMCLLGGTLTTFTVVSGGTGYTSDTGASLTSLTGDNFGETITVDYTAVAGVITSIDLLTPANSEYSTIGYGDTFTIATAGTPCVLSAVTTTGTGMESISSIKLWLSGYNTEDKEHQKILKETFKENIPRSFLTNNFYMETYQITSGLTSYQVECKCKDVVNMIGIFIQYRTGRIIPISDYSFSASGVQIFNSVPQRIANWDQANKGILNQLSVQGNEKSVGEEVLDMSGTRMPTIIDFSLNGTSKHNSGCLPFSHVSSPVIDINFEDPASTCTLFVVYRLHQIATINPADGKIAISQTK